MLNTVHALFLITAVVIWGFSYIAIKIAVGEVTPLQLVCARLLLALPTMWIVGRLGGIPFSLAGVSKQTLGLVAMIGGVIAAHMWIMSEGLRYTTANNTAWILATAPIFILVLSRFTIHEHIASWQMAGMGLASAGVVWLVSGGDLSSMGWITSRGDLLELMTNVTWAIYSIANVALTRRLSALSATFYVTLVATLFVAPLTLATDGLSFVSEINGLPLMAIVFLGVASLELAFWLWAEGIKRIGPTRAGAYLYFEPIFTAWGAWMLLGERISGGLIVAGGLIALGVLLAERGAFWKKATL